MSLSQSQRRMLQMLSFYDTDEHDDPIMYDTSNGNELRTLRSLQQLGLVRLDEDMSDVNLRYYGTPKSRWYARLVATRKDPKGVAPIFLKSGAGYDVVVDGDIIGHTEAQTAYGAGYGTWMTTAAALNPGDVNDGNAGVWITRTRHHGVALLLYYVKGP